MIQHSKVLLLSLVLVLAAAAPALAQASHEDRHLDADAQGEAEDVRTGETFDADVNVTGDVTVTKSEQGVDRTARTDGQTATANVTVNETTYSVPVSVAGEGVSIGQSGVAAEGWRLHVQGTQTPDGGSADDANDTRGAPDDEPGAPTLAQFSGNVTLVGGPNGEYTLHGEGTLTVVEGNATTTYALDYTGSATFD